MKIGDMPKIDSPFVRKMIDGNFVVTDEITPGFEWVFDDELVMAIEKLNGTNVSIVIEHGQIISIWNRSCRIPFFCKGKKHIVDGILNSFHRGYMDLLPDGQHFGELVGKKLAGNPYGIDGHLWIPFETFGQKHLRYKSWGKYPKDFKTISDWFKELMPLYNLMNCDKGMPEKDRMGQFVEGIMFTHEDGRMAKLRKDMFGWYTGKRHRGMPKE